MGTQQEKQVIEDAALRLSFMQTRVAVLRGPSDAQAQCMLQPSVSMSLALTLSLPLMLQAKKCTKAL